MKDGVVRHFKTPITEVTNFEMSGNVLIHSLENGEVKSKNLCQ